MRLPRQPESAPDKTGALLKLALLCLLLLAVLAGATWYQQSMVSPGAVRHDCDLQQGSCQLKVGDGTLRLEAGPLPLRSLSPLKLSLSLDGMDARRIRADLQGAEMYMGINQFELEPATDPKTSGADKTDLPIRSQHWQGKTELAVCTTGSMVWQLTLEIETPEGPQQHLFEFEAR